MRFSIFSAALLLPLFAVADSTASLTTTLTSTQTLTKTITVSEIVASVTSTYARNSTTAGPTGTGATTAVVVKSSTGSAASATKTIPSNYMGAASSLNGMYAGGAGLVVMVVAALL